MKRPNVAKLQAQCDAFNAACPFGTKVLVRIDSQDEPFETVTRSDAVVLAGTTPVVWVKGMRGCRELSRITQIGATP